MLVYVFGTVTDVNLVVLPVWCPLVDMLMWSVRADPCPSVRSRRLGVKVYKSAVTFQNFFSVLSHRKSVSPAGLNAGGLTVGGLVMKTGLLRPPGDAAGPSPGPEMILNGS